MSSSSAFRASRFLAVNAAAPIIFGMAITLAAATASAADPRHEPPRVAERNAAQATDSDAAELQQAWAGLTQAERDTLVAATQSAITALKNLTPAQKAQLKNAATQLAKGLKSLTPQQRAALAIKLGAAAAVYAQLTVEQKQAFLSALAKTIDAFQTASPETRAKLKALHEKIIGT